MSDILTEKSEGLGSGTSSPLSFFAYWAIFGVYPQEVGQAHGLSCLLAPQWPHWSPPSSVSQNASADVPVVLGAEEMHPSGRRGGGNVVGERKAPQLFKGDQVTQIPLKLGNLGSPQRRSTSSHPRVGQKPGKRSRLLWFGVSSLPPQPHPL